MKREEMIDKAIKVYSIENIHYGFEQISKDFRNNSFQILKKCLWEFDTVFRKIKENGKENICFLAIYFMYSSLQLNNFKLQVEMYNEQHLFDKNPVTDEIDFSFVLKYYEEELTYYKEYMRTEVMQVKYQEILKYRKLLQSKYKKIVCEVLEQFLPYIISLKSFNEINKCEKFYITYGEYFSEAVCLYSKDTTSSNE